MDVHSQMAVVRTRIVAHRFGSLLWPENSGEGLLGSIGLRVNEETVDMVEIDVHMSKDGHVVVFHDATLDRLTNHSGPIGERTFADLQRICWESNWAKPMLTLDGVCRALKDTPIDLSLELKVDELERPYPQMADEVSACLARNSFVDRTFVHSFHWPLLDDIRHHIPGILVGGNVDDEAVERLGSMDKVLAALGNAHVQEFNGDHEIMNEKLFAKIEAAGFGVTLWTVNKEANIDRWLHAGVDAIATDRPDVGLRRRQELQGAPII